MDVADPLLEQADAHLDQTLTLFRGVILRVLTQIAELAGPFDLLRQLRLQFLLELRDLILELLEYARLQGIPPETGTAETGTLNFSAGKRGHSTFPGEFGGKVECPRLPKKS
jgi:hypothetical protein